MPATLRRFSRPGDFPGLAALFNAAVDATGYGEHVTVERLAAGYEPFGRCDPATDVTVAERDGEVVGYARVRWDDTSEGYRAYWLVVVAREGDEGLERRLFDWVVDRAAALAANHDVADRRLHVRAVDGTSLQAMLDAVGFTAFQPTAMLTRPLHDELPRHPPPGGVEIRPVDADHLRAIWDAESAALEGEPLIGRRAEADWERFRDQAAATGTGLWQIAWAGDKVVGQVRTRVGAAGHSQRRAYTEDISTRPEWRRRGVASALICASLHQLAELGFGEAALSADAQEGARPLALYESLGYRMVCRAANYTRPV